MTHTIENYLRENVENNVIDFSIRASIINGKIHFYIHPACVSGDTVDFDVNKNCLECTCYCGGLTTEELEKGRKVNPFQEYGERDYPEHRDLENGNYWNTCSECGLEFIGHKSMTVCKLCKEGRQS